MDSSAEIVQDAEEANRNLMPQKSRNRYYKELSDFNEWRQKTNVSTVLSENIIMAYISRLSKKYKASSLWTKFSMLKKAFIVNGDVDISRYGKVMAFMKKQNINFVPKKFKTLGVAECRKFILEASDDYLLSKVVLVFGLYGACCRDDLLKLTVDDIEDHQKYVLVKLRHNSRSFIIPDASESFNPYEIYQKYSKLRPHDVGTRRFFLGYRQGKCISQPAGMHTIGGVPRKVAEFLGLDHPENYTGHCLRRSGAKFSGNILPGMQMSSWRSTQGAEGYIEESGYPGNIHNNAAASSSREEFSSRNAEFHRTGKDYQPYLDEIGSHLLAAFKDQSESLQYNDHTNETYPSSNSVPNTPIVTGLPNPYEDDNLSFSTDNSNPMKDTYLSVKPDPDTPMGTGLPDSYDNGEMNFKSDNNEPITDTEVSIKPDPDTPMDTILTNPYDNTDMSYSTDNNDHMTDTPLSPESDFVTPVAMTCSPTILPDSDPESQKPPSVLKRKFKKQLNYKDMYYKKMYEIACFELKSKKVIHNLDVKIKKKQLEQLEN